RASGSPTLPNAAALLQGAAHACPARWWDGRSVLPEPGAGGDPHATGPGGRGHLLLAERLDLAELDRRGGGADVHGVLGDLELAGLEGVALDGRHRAELEPLP